MKWSEKQPQMGRPVRVKAAFYYHYGIFEDDEHVYAFGLPDNTGITKEQIAVVCTDISTFLGGGMLESAELTFKEKLHALSAKQVLSYAKRHVGELGYDILKNNCEHFTLRCLFGEEKAANYKVQ